MQQHDDRGWLSRFGNGFTKRANSVTVDAAIAPPFDARIDELEVAYRARGLPPAFRLLFDNAPSPPAGRADPHAAGTLDEALAARGYAWVDPSLVMVADTAARTAGAPPDLLAADEWLAHWARLAGTDGPTRQRHAEVLAAIRPACGFGVWRADGQVVACGLAVRDGGLLGLFDIVTDPALRGRGHGAAITTALVAWGARAGARTAYLQVLEANAVAVRLYARLGFRTLYRYGYRIAPVQ